jgi:peroxiredoxin
LTLPADLPRPQDDGAADGLEGRPIPEVRLVSTTADPVDLAEATRSITVVYVYPRTGVPGEPLPPGWMETPGAFGCTAESCAFRDHAAELGALGASVAGLSAQPLEEQRDFTKREHIPYPLLNDSDLVLERLLGLPTFEAAGMRLYRRLTLVARDSRVIKAFYPVFPPDEHPAEVVAWLRSAFPAAGS